MQVSKLRNKFIAALISTLIITGSAYSEDFFDDASYYSGDNFFKSSSYIEKTQGQSDEKSSSGSAYNDKEGTIPPLKKMRMHLQKKSDERREQQSQLAPTDPNASIYNSEKETSDYASKELQENFDETMMPDGFEADEEAVEETKKAKHFWLNGKDKKAAETENTENIVLDCDNMDYDTENYCLYADRRSPRM